METKTYNAGRIPKFKDVIHRFQNKQGVWRRIVDNCMVVDKNNKLGSKILKKDFIAKDDEVLKDKIGSFYVANNGVKVYIDYKR